MKNQRVLITGAGGRVGAAIAFELARDNEVHGVDLFDHARPRLEAGGVVFHQLCLGTGRLDCLPEQFDYVFHQAVTWSVANREEQAAAENVSVRGVLRLMRRFAGAKRFVLGSTGGVLGESEELADETALRRPDSDPYHAYKFAMEVMAEAMADEEGIDIVIPRYYWPWSATNGFPHTWVIVPMLRDRPVSICKAHPVRTTPIFMPDCVRYSIAAAEAPEVPRILHISGNEVVSLAQIATMVGEMLDVAPVFEDSRPRFVSFLGNPALCTQLFGPPEYTVRKAVETAVQWHKEHPAEHQKREIFDAPATW
jgi:nucleoside-diphosphate-sugar epimerase